MQLSAKVMTFDPAQAANILAEKNKYNIRKPKQRIIDAYARDLSAGHWQLNGETIIFDKEDQLLNGQQRLAAVVQSGTPLTTVVVKGVDRATFRTMDGGYKRDLAQVLTMGAFPGIEGTNVRIASSVTRMLYLYERSGRSGAGLKTGAPTRQEAIEVYEENAEAIMAAVEKVRKRLELATPAIGAFCYVLFARQNQQKADEFFDYLINGTMLVQEQGEAGEATVRNLPVEKDHPAHMLRERLIKNAKSTAKLPLLELIALFFLAWNAYKAGLRMGRLSWRSDAEFPSIEPPHPKGAATPQGLDDLLGPDPDPDVTVAALDSPTTEAVS